MVKDHSNSERGNPQPPLYGLLLPMSSKSSFICSIHRQGSTYPDLCYNTSRGTLTGTGNGSVGPSWGIDPTTHRTMSGRSSMEWHLAPLWCPMHLIVHHGTTHDLAINNPTNLSSAEICFLIMNMVLSFRFYHSECHQY